LHSSLAFWQGIGACSNGVVERLVGHFKSMLERHVNSHPVHWAQSVPILRQQNWARVHQILGMPPQELVFVGSRCLRSLWRVTC
jgi:hypothetical protein